MKDLNSKKFFVHMISAIVARAVFWNMNPLAIGYFAAVYLEGAGGITLLICSALGVISRMGLLDGAPYLLILLFTYVVLELLDKRKPMVFKPFCYIVPIIFTAFVRIFVFQNGNKSEIHTLLYILEMLLVFVFTVLVRRGIRVLLHLSRGFRPNSEQVVSISILLAVVLYAIPKLEFTYFSPIHTIMYFLTIFTVYKYGVGPGAVTGAVCGFITCISGGSMADIGIFCLLGIAPALFRELGRISIATIYVVTATGLWMFQYGEIFSVSEFGALISAVLVFLLLPKNLIYRVDNGMYHDRKDTTALQNVRSIARERMLGFSESFLKLADAYANLSDKNAVMERQEINHIFEELSDRLCKNCTHCEKCWEQEFTNTYQAACDVFDVAERHGYIEMKDIPASFQSVCMCADEFCREANRGFELAKLNRTWYNKMAESRDAISTQFLEVAKVMKELASDLYNTVDLPMNKEEKVIILLKANQVIVRNITMIEKSNKRIEIYLKAACRHGRCMTTKEAATMISDALSMRVIPSPASKTVISKDYETYVFMEDTRYKVLTGLARAKKDKDTVSGDNFTIQTLESGESLVVLADGMGTGMKACEESEEVISLLEQLILAGFKREVAIKLVNSSMLLKNADQSFSTIDMSVINLFTGMCDFVKLGAASTFIKRDHWVETITSTSLPIGMFHKVDYDSISKKLYDGDIVIMVTDGILDSFSEIDKEAYMQNLILNLNSSNPQEIANKILQAALDEQNNVPVDDMTVIAVGLWEKV